MTLVILSVLDVRVAVVDGTTCFDFDLVMFVMIDNTGIRASGKIYSKNVRRCKQKNIKKRIPVLSQLY